MPQTGEGRLWGAPGLDENGLCSLGSSPASWLQRWCVREPAKQEVRNEVFVSTVLCGIWRLSPSFQARLTKSWFYSGFISC